MKIDPGLSLSEKRAIAGRLGGRRTVRRHGKRYMRRLARWGAHVMHSRYMRLPVALNDFAITDRKTGQVVALLSGRPIETVFGTAEVVLHVPDDCEELSSSGSGMGRE